MRILLTSKDAINVRQLRLALANAGSPEAKIVMAEEEKPEEGRAVHAVALLGATPPGGGSDIPAIVLGGDNLSAMLEAEVVYQDVSG